MLAKFLFYLSIILILQGYPMTAFTDYTENAIANHIFRGIAFTMPAALYAALFSAVANGETGSVTELSGNGYARAACNPGTSNWNAPVAGNGTVANGVAITFPQASGDWGTVAYWGLYDAATGGNLLVYAPLANSRNITNEATPSFAAGAMTIQIDN